jgi:hypothetical protein
MLSKTLLVMAFLCAAILVGCSKTDDNTNTMAGNSNQATPSDTAKTTAPAGDKIGIAECDDYIAKYEACTGKVPEAARATYKSSLEQMRTQWKKMADNPATKSALASACKQATEQQTAAWKAYGCAN